MSNLIQFFCIQLIRVKIDRLLNYINEIEGVLSYKVEKNIIIELYSF